MTPNTHIMWCITHHITWFGFVYLFAINKALPATTAIFATWHTVSVSLNTIANVQQIPNIKQTSVW